MRIFLLTLFLLILAISVQAEIQESPDQILYSTSIGTLNIVDNYLVSASSNGVSLFVYDSLLEQYKFLLRKHISSFEPIDAKISDLILIVRTSNEKIHFISLQNLPELTYLGSVSVSVPIADYDMINNSLYIAGYYEGILRYSLTNYNQANFVDSSMTGILVTQLSHDDNYLYALDEYNGILKYELNPFNFGIFVDYLFVPLRIFQYTQIDSLFYLHLLNGGLLVADFEQPKSLQIVDSIYTYGQVHNLYVTDSLLMIPDNRTLQIIERSDFSDLKSFYLPDVNPSGLLNPHSDIPSMMLPSTRGGLSFVTVDTSVVISDGLQYNGAVSDLLIYDSKLFVSSNAEAVNIFSIDTNGVTTFQYPLYENLTYSGPLANNGDSLFALYPDINKLAIIVHADQPDSSLLENSISIASGSVREMYYNNEQLYDNALIFVEYPYQFDIYAVSDSGYLLYENNWNFVSDMTTFAVKDSIAVITNRKNECEVYRIRQNYGKEILTTFGMSGPATKSIFNGNLLYLFQEEEMYIVDFSDRSNIQVDTVLTLPFDVLDAQIVDNFMFTVGKQGIGKFDISGVLPEIVDSGGLPGESIEVDSNLVAIYNANTIMLYYHDLPVIIPNDVQDNHNYTYLSQNYPNPFNLETVISYLLPQRTDVQIAVYNILGQRIKTLIDQNQEAGDHSVSWDGTNANGNIIASGVYFYRLETSEFSVAKKMILIK